ncbi:hypothetical protein F4780DRAFT_476127 [Xylariomycetidae sp. FL0641]|nr:hypothetical protein F4780DRAFT_476127 [Xylariomycetidae sp. FL0641]
MPAYASACASAAAYASACSCLGVASTVTATQLERAGAKNTSSLHTTTRPSLNITHPLALNHTRVVPSLNGTSARFGNSSTSTSATATPSATIDRTCGATTTPFALRASVPGGNGSAVVVDGWFVGLTGDAALLLPPATNDNNGNGNNARFSVEGSGHLCAVGVEGSSGNAAIAVVNTFNGDDDGGGSAGSAGSAVYFVDGELLGVVEGQGYAALACEEAADGGEVKCAHGDWGAWTRCGLGLGITGQTDGNAVVDGWNCTGVALEAVFAS